MATTMETATNGAIVANQGPRNEMFRGLFRVIPFTFSFEEDSIGAEDTSQKDITVTGAKLGDFVLIGPTVDLVSINMFGFVASANTVTINAQNLETADANTTLATIATHNGLVLQPVDAWPGN
jgi:hypothetical protein